MPKTGLPSVFQQYIHLSRYSRYDWDGKRRETWEETVNRWITFFRKHLAENTKWKPDEATMEEVRQHILELGVMPSMRTVMTAGDALARDNIAAYNCSYVAVNRVSAFDEILYILMCGTGVGFSVERCGGIYVNEPCVID